MEELTSLHTKLDKLLKKHNTLIAENDRMRKQLEKKDGELDKFDRKINELEAALANVKTGEVIANTEDSSAVKKQLDGLIGDIDKLLATLND